MEYFLKKIWLSAILSILVLITGVTSTYAWYAMTRTNNVEDFNLISKVEIHLQFPPMVLIFKILYHHWM